MQQEIINSSRCCFRQKRKTTTDAKKALEGVQLPIAGFRGSGLAWILSGVLTGGNHAGRVKDPFDDFSGPQILDIYL